MFKSLASTLCKFSYSLPNIGRRFIPPTLCQIKSQSIHTTSVCRDLMEFFEDRKNLGKDEVRCGRPWSLDDLRIKSNGDLHKIWYILLKEKNMLLTMEEYYKENYILFPSPERIDKVEESMSNLETVVRERNRAYYLLETGEDGERPCYTAYSAIGLPFNYKMTQHFLPRHKNRLWKWTHFIKFDTDECTQFLRLYKEKLRRKKRWIHKIRKKEVARLFARFKNIDRAYMKELYPDVNVDRVAETDRARGYWQK